MSSNVIVTLERTTRKATIKTTPGMLLSEIVAAVHKELRLGPVGPCSLKEGKSELPLGHTVRQARLPLGAKLTLGAISAARASTIQVALQVGAEPRMMQAFPSSSTLLGVLEAFASANPTLNILKKAGPPVSMTTSAGKTVKRMKNTPPPVWHLPALLIMGKEYRGDEVLSSTTLGTLGLSQGTLGIRVNYYPTDTVVEGGAEACPVDEDVKEEIASPAEEAKSSPKVIDTPKAQTEEVVTTTPEPAAPIVDRAIQVFCAPSGNGVPMSSKIELPDDFFVLSSAELKSELASQKKRQEMGNKFISTAAKARMAMEERRKRYPRTMVRVRFPDRTQLQGTFSSAESIDDIYRWVRSSLVDASIPFILYTTPPKVVLKEGGKGTLLTEGLAPATICHLSIPTAANPGSLIQPQLLDQAISLVPEAAKEERSATAPIPCPEHSEEKEASGDVRCCKCPTM